ncbi:MAG: GNAT family N-acetyltransferase [Thermonemataceae bacterium]
MIRKYNEKDKPDLIKLLKLNTPKFFAPLEEKDFIDYLNNHSESYYVVEESTQIIGAGGLNYGFDKGTTARISWDIIHPNKQGQGIGTELIKYRIEEIKKHPHISKIVVRTTQLVYKFYEKIGFQLEKVENNFWAKGFDLYEMTIQLNHQPENE